MARLLAEPRQMSTPDVPIPGIRPGPCDPMGIIAQALGFYACIFCDELVPLGRKMPALGCRIFCDEPVPTSPENARFGLPHFLRRTGAHFAGKCSLWVVAFSATN